MAEYQYNPNVEQWKEIPGFPGYEASDHGRIRSFWTIGGSRFRGGSRITNQPRVMKAWMNFHGYLTVGLRGKPRQKIHRLVLLAFIGQPPPKHECCHSDGNRQNNHLPNLRWDTRSANLLDRRRHGTINSYQGLCGTNNPNCKLTEYQVLEIRKLIASGYTQEAIAAMFPIHRATVSNIARRITWFHI